MPRCQTASESLQHPQEQVFIQPMPSNERHQLCAHVDKLLAYRKVAASTFGCLWVGEQGKSTLACDLLGICNHAGVFCEPHSEIIMNNSEASIVLRRTSQNRGDLLEIPSRPCEDQLDEFPSCPMTMVSEDELARLKVLSKHLGLTGPLKCQSWSNKNTTQTQVLRTPQLFTLSLVAVDTSAKSLTFCGFNGKTIDFNQKVKV